MHATRDGGDSPELRTGGSVASFPSAPPHSSQAPAGATQNDKPIVISGLKSAGCSQYRREHRGRIFSGRRIHLFDLKSRIVIEVIHVH